MRNNHGVAPAFPARTHDGERPPISRRRPLEETEFWRREGISGGASLLDMMAAQILKANCFRSSDPRRHLHTAAMTDAAERTMWSACGDEEDLAALAQASGNFRRSSMGWFGGIDRTSVRRRRCIATEAYPAPTHVVGRSPAVCSRLLVIRVPSSGRASREGRYRRLGDRRGDA
jgi:hypothetical protein